MTFKDLQNEKGFATLRCLQRSGGCGAKTSASHWHCGCGTGDTKWYKCPIHCRHQKLAAHHQDRGQKPKSKPAKVNTVANDEIPIIRIKTRDKPQIAPHRKKRNRTSDAHDECPDMSDSEPDTSNHRQKLDPNACPTLFKRLQNKCPERFVNHTLCSDLCSPVQHSSL